MDEYYAKQKQVFRNILMSLNANNSCHKMNNQLNELYFLLNEFKEYDLAFYNNFFPQWAVMEEYCSLALADNKEYLEAKEKASFQKQLGIIQQKLAIFKDTKKRNRRRIK